MSIKLVTRRTRIQFINRAVTPERSSPSGSTNSKEHAPAKIPIRAINEPRRKKNRNDKNRNGRRAPRKDGNYEA